MDAARIPRYGFEKQISLIGDKPGPLKVRRAANIAFGTK
jgi:hypothetical protein